MPKLTSWKSSNRNLVINPRPERYLQKKGMNHNPRCGIRLHRSSGESTRIPKKFLIQIPRAVRGSRSLENREARSRSSSKARYKSDRFFVLEFQPRSRLSTPGYLSCPSFSSLHGGRAVPRHVITSPRPGTSGFRRF